MSKSWKLEVRETKSTTPELACSEGAHASTTPTASVGR
jgi:hypothetical protein